METILLMVADGQNGVWPWNVLPWVFGAVLLMLGLIDKVEAASGNKWNPENSHGDAKFIKKNADFKKAGLLSGEGVPIGYTPDGRHALHYPGFGHLLCVAAARTGKGASLLVNALLSWRYSVICIDPKAENALVCAKSRKRFGRVHILNPFKMFAEELGNMQARFNPMDLISSASASFHAECDKLAAALVWDEGTSEGAHWPVAARILVSGIIAALIRHEVPQKKNLVEVARLISSGDELFTFCRTIMKHSNDPFIKQKLQRFALPVGKQPAREMEDVISTAITQLGFIGNAAIAESLSGSSFRFSDAKTKPGTTVFICLPLNMLDVCDKYFRLILETALSDLLNEGRRGRKKPVLVICDEMAQLGPRVKILENSMGMAAGAAGIQLWCVLQDISQLKGMFEKTWETFIQNCGVTMWFGAKDHSTREYVSKLAGTKEALTRSRNWSTDRQTGETVVNDSASQFGRPLLLDHEVGEIAPDEMVLFVEGRMTVKAKRRFYFTLPEFRGKYRKNPYIKGGGK
jgi:type IV secretion system protein VirD4